MKIKLLIDHREPDKLLEIIERTCSEYVSVERQNLSFGDFQFIRDGECRGEVLMVIERKTKADLLSSVNDGRYRNQKRTLIENVEKTKIYYILEEMISGELISDETILGCAISMMVRDGFKIIQTKDIIDTAKFISGLCKRFSKNYEKYFGNSEGDGCLNIVKRRQAPSSNDVFLNMIMQIPGLSDKSARVICDKYPTLASLYDEYSIIQPDRRVDVLRNATPVGGRKISKTAIENLIRVFFEDK